METLQKTVATTDNRISVVQATLLIVVAAAIVGGAIAQLLGFVSVAGSVWTVALLAIAMRLQFTQHWQPFAFTFWVLAFVMVAMFFPAIFRQWLIPNFSAWWSGSAAPSPSTATWIAVDPAKSMVAPLIQVIMFGMGTTLGLRDFARILKAPKPVLIGMVLQFGVMPLLGFGLASAFYLPPEIAAGVVLIGSCPGALRQM